MAAFSCQNRSFSGQNQTFLNPVGISQPIFEFQGQKSPNDMINHLADQTIQFDIPEDGRFSSVSCSEITTQAINLRPVSNTRPHDAENALRHLYDQSTMGYLGWQEIMNLIMIEQEQVAAALYGPSAGDCDANSLQDRNPKDGENHQTIADKKNCISKHSRFKVMDGQFSAHTDMDVHRGKVHASHGKMKKGQTDQYDSESVIETYVQVSAQKGHLKRYNRVICKSSLSSNCTSKAHEENSKLKLNVSKGDPPELLPNIVQEEDKAPGTQIDYIRVRARRGQATDRHSLAERARRERINKRMKILQNLVPGCNKITSKALVLEEIINYVQSLQKQVEILTMKLASLVPLGDLQHQISSLPYEEMQIDDTNMA